VGIAGAGTCVISRCPLAGCITLRHENWIGKAQGRKAEKRYDNEEELAMSEGVDTD
jgi:hypothetical protein